MVLVADAVYFLDVGLFVCLLWVWGVDVIRVGAVFLADVAFCAFHVVCEHRFVGVSVYAYA